METFLANNGFTHSRPILKQEFPVMPVKYINKVLQQNRNFLAAAYAALVDADRTYNSQANPPYQKLNAPRKPSDNNEHAKMGKVWTEITNELDYARHRARKEQCMFLPLPYLFENRNLN